MVEFNNTPAPIPQTPVSAPVGAPVPANTGNPEKTANPEAVLPSSWQQIVQDVNGGPDLEFASFNVEDAGDLDLGAMIAATLILSVRSSQETSLAQQKRLKAAGGDFVKINERTMELIDQRREEIEKALEAQGSKKWLGIGMMIAGILGTVLSAGTLSAPAMALVAVGTAMTTLTAVNDLTDGKLFQETFNMSEEDAQKLSMTLTIVGSILMFGAGAAGAAKNAATKLSNSLARFTGQAAKKGVEEGAEVAAKQGLKQGLDAATDVADDFVDDAATASTKSADDAASSSKGTKKGAKGGTARGGSSTAKDNSKLLEKRRALAEKLGMTEEEFLLRTQQIEVLLAAVEGILGGVTNVNQFKERKFNANVQIVQADQQVAQADFTELQSEVELLLERYQANNDEGVAQRTQKIAELIDIFLKTQLTHYRAT